MTVRSSRALFFLALTFSFSLHASESVETFQPPGMPGWSSVGFLAKVKSQTVSILDYVRAHMTTDTLAGLESHVPRYNRREDFGGWTLPDTNTDCFDTRARVLIRSADPATKLTYNASHCTVVKGLWHEPYAGTDYKTARSVQIDHVVPLKHAYVTGAADWAPERRCYYANFLHNSFHLLAVSGHENMSKGDNSPDKYLPPNESFQCEYVADWLKVKAIWDLVATQDEMRAIDAIIQARHCAISKFEYDQTDLDKERAATFDVSRRCKDFASVGAADFY